MKLTILIFLLYSLYCSNKDSISKETRVLQEISQLYFIKASHLFFNKDKKHWEFNINYISSNALEKNKEYSVSILFNDKPSLANCTAITNSTMNCTVTIMTQTKLDLIKLNNELNEANIEWKNLSKIYEIPLDCSLIFKDIYPVNNSYHPKEALYHYDFEIKLEKSNLPEESLVYIDIIFGDTLLIPPCYYSYDTLFCNFKMRSYNDWIGKILPKKSGSVDWVNIDNKTNIYLPIRNNITTTFDSWGLQLINLKWHFKLQCRSEHGPVLQYFTINVKIIKQNGDNKIHLAKCSIYDYNKAANDLIHYLDCIVEGENQDIYDLVYLSNTQEHHSSIEIFKYGNCQNIKRNANLKFIKAYDYFNQTSIKILVGDDQNLPNNAVLSIDIIYSSGHTYSKKCIYNNHILTCPFVDDSSYVTYIHNMKYLGSVTWNNIQERTIIVPKNISLEFVKAHSLFFIDKWHFIVKFINKNYRDIPTNTTFLIDIIHNNKEVTATCNVKTWQDMVCTSDYENQSKTDQIKLRKYIKYGTINWKIIITDDTIPKATSINPSLLDFEYRDAYDMYFSKSIKRWVFTIYAGSKSQNYEGTVIVDILINKTTGDIIESTASCLVLYSRNGVVRLLCLTEYDNQEKTDLISINPEKTNSESITWSNTFKKYNLITLKTELYLQKYSWNTVNNRRIYNITVKDDENNVLPIGARVIVDQDAGNYIKVINCTVTKKNFLFCNTSEGGYQLNYLKSYKSSVTWLNDKNDDAFYVYLSKQLELISADKLYFNDTEKKWYFNLTVSEIYGKVKLAMDILIDEIPEIAICKLYTNILHCFVNLENQNKKSKIKLTNRKSENSCLTWKNSVEDIMIPLWTELTYEQAGNLKHEKNKWIFDIKVKEDNLPENSLVILDIYTIYSDINYLFKEFENFYTIDCIYNNKTLNCETTEISSSHTIQLITTKNPYSKSTVYKWHNVINEEKISFNLETNLSIIYNTRIKKNSEGKYIFSMELNTYIPIYSQSTVDILYGNQKDISICIADYYWLDCEINEEKYLANNNEIYLSKTKSEISSITWNNLYENQILFPVKFKFVYAYYKTYSEDIINDIDNEENNYYINILIDEDKIENKNLIFSTKFLLIEKKTSKEKYAFFEACKIKDEGILHCKIRYLDDDEDFIILANGNEGLIDWINPNNYTYDKTNLYIINYQNLFFCVYDEINNYYNYEIKVQFEDNENKPDQFVMDLLINDNYTYGICTCIDKSRNIYDCHTRKMLKEENHKIKITNGSPINSNTELRNFPDNFVIYPNNSTLVKASCVYDLTFNNNINKWEFKIDPLNDVKIEQYKTLDILINDNPDTANCKTNNDNNIIECIVNSNVQNNNQLIQLSPDYIFKDNNIYLSNIKQHNIPLISKFEYINASNLKYNKTWSFNLIVSNNDNNFFIPSGSLFSMDIIYDSNKNDLAFCTEKERNNNNQLTLICTPKNDIQNNSLITLSNLEKSKYASITFNPSLTEANKYIYFYTNLNVTQVYMTESENDNNFYMTFINDISIPLNGRVILDLIYNDQDTIAICFLKETKKFECSPDISEQNPNDIFSISPYVNKATVSFINSANKLKFLNILNFVKVYNLKYDKKWTFKILLEKSKIKNGKSFDINILIDDEEDISNCIYNNNILTCELNSKNVIQDQFSIIKIINDYNNNEIVWINLPEVLTIYNENQFRLIDIHGGFYNKKWIFNIYFLPTNKNKITYNNFYLLDILVNNNIESTAICESTYSSFLKCVADYENQNINDKILIDVNKDPKLGTITFQKLQVEPQKIIDYVTFSINYEINSGYLNQNDKLEIIIEGTLQKNLEYDIEEDTITMIELVKYNKSGNKNYYDISCATNNIKKNKGSYVYMICETELSIDNDKIEINIDENKYSKYVQFSQLTNIEIIVDKK